MTKMLTWQADDGCGFEGTRLLLGSAGFRAMGRMVRVGADGGFTASYRLDVGVDGALQRVSLTSATAQRERHLTLNRTEDGFWLVDTGSGGSRASFDGAVDLDLAHSAMFNTLPIRRLALHRGIGDHTLKMVFVTLPELRVQPVVQQYRTVSALDDDGSAVIAFSWDEFSADLVVDTDGVVTNYPGVAKQQSAHGVASTAG